MKDFSKMDIRPQSRRRTAQKEINIHTGYDTETLHGYCRLICDSNKNYLYFGDNPNMTDNEILTAILKFLLRNDAKAGLHWFYNVDYDFRSIIKYLSSDKLIELYNDCKTTFNGYSISFLPNKFFRISRGNHSNTFYDISHFFAGGLDKNAKKYLNSQKDDKINSKILGESARYWQENKFMIIDYCIQDCKLTADLARLFYSNLWKEIKFNPAKPFSAGSISQEYFINNSKFIPKISDIPSKVLELHQNNYRGGRIEIMKKGYFKHLESYDLKSAYPSIMIDLLDYTKGNWISSTDYDEDIHGIYNIKYQWFNTNLGLFPHTVDGLTIYPNVINDYAYTTVNERELQFLDNNTNFADYEILSGFQFIPYKEEYPYRECLLRLFEQKENAERENNENKRMIYKLFINSIYGKTAESIFNRNTGLYETGRLYNPIYANRITSLTRLKLINAGIDIAASIVGFSTDSILTEKPIHAKFIDNSLGMFTHEYSARDSVVLMSGVRYIQKVNDNNELEFTQKMRGFSNELNLKELLELNRDKDQIPTHIYKPLTLFQGLKYNNLDKSDINVFSDNIKILDINGDMRRLWCGSFVNADECLKRNINSVPIPI